MKKIIICLVFTVISFSAKANSVVNFECDIFAVGSDEKASGRLSLSGTSLFEQSYQLSIADGEGAELKGFDGVLFLQGQMEFASLNKDIQKAISASLEESQASNADSDPLIVFGNTNDNTSTFRVYLMPTFKIAYLEVGLLQVLCN